MANENLKNADVEPGKEHQMPKVFVAFQEFSAKLQRIPGMRRVVSRCDE